MKIIVDDATRKRLLAVRRTVLICDKQGVILGHFSPTADPALYSIVEPDIGEEELQRREQETETYATAEVLQRLQRL